MSTAAGKPQDARPGVLLVGEVHGRTALVSNLRELLGELADASRAEPQCADFRVLVAEEPGELVLVASWSTEEAMREHHDSPHYRYYREHVGPLLDRPSDVVVYQVSAVLHARDPNPPDPGLFG
jgi:quinol monooxygenase YgiN